MSDSFTLGIDPAKAKFTAQLLGPGGQAIGRAIDYSSDRDGLDQLLARLRAHLGEGDRLVVGVVDGNLVAWLGALRECFAVTTLRLDPAQVAHFSGARPIRGKTDRADARRIAQFTRTYGERLDGFECDGPAQAMARLVNEREQLVAQGVAVQNRLQDRLVLCFPEFIKVFAKPCGPLALAALEKMPTAAHGARRRVGTLARAQSGRRRVGEERAEQLAQLARESIASATCDFDAEAMVELIGQLRRLRERVARIEKHLADYAGQATAAGQAERPAGESIGRQINLASSVRGIGLVGAATVVLRSRGLARFSRAKALAAQLGTCPDRDQTGSSRERSRLTHRGDRRTRSTLYMITQTTIWHDPALAFLKWRLVRAGKTPKQAICACMNRLARVLWTMVRDDRPYDALRAIEQARLHFPILWKTFVQEKRTCEKLWENIPQNILQEA
jgi:transposase